jgi:hypothetical protein
VGWETSEQTESRRCDLKIKAPMTKRRPPTPPIALPGPAPIPPGVSHMTGMEGMGRFIVFASRQGWHIYESVDGHAPCDCIVDTAGGLIRVEVKRIASMQKCSNHDTHYYYTATKLATKKFDYLFISTPQGDYFIPAQRLGRSVSIVDHPKHRDKWGGYRIG